MGRKKVEIKERETKEGRQVTFSKRRMGLEKKAQQLSTLCDIPLLLLLFSPSNRLSWISGSHGTPEELLSRYADISFGERNKRRIEVLEQLDRAFEKTDHKINMEDFLWQTSDMPSSIKDSFMFLQSQKSNLLQELREYETPMTIEHARQIESILRIRLQQIQLHMSLMESNQCLASYNQTLLDEKPLSISSQCLVPSNETLGQQGCYEDSTICRAMDVTSQDSWTVTSTFEHDAMPLLEHNTMPLLEQDSMPFLPQQGVCGIASGSLQSPSILSNNCLSDTTNHLGKQQQMCVCHLSTHGGNIRHQNGEGADDNLLFSVGEDHSFLGGSLPRDCDFCLLNNLHHTKPNYFEPSIEYEEVKPLNLPALNTFLR